MNIINLVAWVITGVVAIVLFMLFAPILAAFMLVIGMGVVIIAFMGLIIYILCLVVAMAIEAFG